MELLSKNQQVTNKHLKRLQASEHLVKNKLFNEAALLKWLFLRELLFQECFQKNLLFQSTEEAVSNIICEIEELSSKADLYFLYSISILIEWDKDFEISEMNYFLFEKKFEKLINHLNVWT